MNEAVILAGGFGTRLRQVVSDLPKPMAPVAGRPFLCHLLDRLQGCYDHVVLATGYMHEAVEEYFGSNYGGIKIDYARETKPLGTGGAIVNALASCREERITVLNGDTLFDIAHSQFIQQADALPSRLVVATRRVPDAGRYGALLTDEDSRIVAFAEKRADGAPGQINGGIYRMQRQLLDAWKPGAAFSFEQEVLQQLAEPFYAIPSEAYFIDIGVPDDYHRAQLDLAPSTKPSE
ncbi:MAG: nucleotidyltransferase family protein [Bacteroidales bacterium]|nr:nucleotidyltransferase family protein [Bacteroidales bacterium]